MKRRDIQKIKVPTDNYGRVYIGLLETKLTPAAKLCYGVMWSFGAGQIWASIPSIAKRMSMSPRTVRTAQIELEKHGWIKMLENPAGLTKSWEMVTPATIAAPPLQNLQWSPATIAAPPLQNLHTKQEGNQEANQEREAAPSAPLSPPTAEGLKELNQLRAAHKLVAIQETPISLAFLKQAVFFYGAALIPSYLKYLESKDRHWGPSFPLAGFASESQVENWKVTTPVSSRCQHTKLQDEIERIGSTKHNAAGTITIRRCVGCKKKVSEIFVPDPAWVGHGASA